MHRYGIFERENAGPDVENDIEIIPIKTPPFKIKNNTNFKRVMNDAVINLNESIAELNLHGSGFTLIEVLKINVKIAR